MRFVPLSCLLTLGLECACFSAEKVEKMLGFAISGEVFEVFLTFQAILSFGPIKFCCSPSMVTLMKMVEKVEMQEEMKVATP